MLEACKQYEKKALQLKLTKLDCWGQKSETADVLIIMMIKKIMVKA